MRSTQRRFALCTMMALGLVAVGMAPPRAIAALTLVRDGAPQATIVVAKAVLNPAKEDVNAQKVATAAQELRAYVEKMSGARLPIVSDEQTPKGALILIGRSRLTDAMKVDIPAGLTPARREEGFVIVCKGERLVLAGNDAGPYHGTEYATYDFLERLGVRWFMPGEFGEVVPKQTTLAFADITVRQRPDFIQRNWWLHTTDEMAALERRWKIRNKMNPDNLFQIPGDSSVRNFVADPKEAAAHPELFAKNLDGSVNPFLPNLTNPKAVEIAAEKMKALFRKDPSLNSGGIAPDDGLPRDFSPETVKRNQGFTDLLGREGVPGEMSVSEEWFDFVNALTREVKKEFPNHVITTNGYANRNTPPEGVALDPNVSVMFAAIWSDTLHAYDDPKSWQAVRQGQMLQRWCELNPGKVWIYGYDYRMLVSGLTPVPITRKLARDFPLMKKWGVMGFIDEARNVWMEGGITSKYVRARLEWDANANVKTLLADFFSKWYGAAAPPSQAFWDALEETMESTPLLGHEDRILPFVYTPELMVRLKTHIEEAERLADTDRAKQHVQVDRLIYEHLKGYLALHAAEVAGDFAGAARQADAMMEIRKQLHAINSFFVLPDEQRYKSGIWYWGALDRKAYYEKLAALTSGKTGDLVTLLPETAAFRLDPHDEGRFARWHKPDLETAAWTSVLTTKPFYTQGHLSREGYPYTGYLWYRLNADIPASAKGKRVVLYAPVVETEAWCWVNGKYIGHRPYREAYERPSEMEFDVTDALEPGKPNVIAIRVGTGSSRAAAASGLLSRVFLFTPKSEKPGQLDTK